MVPNDVWQSLFAPKSVAVVGASNNLGSWGGRIMQNLLATGNRPIYAVNPKYSEIYGLTSYDSLTKIPDPIDLVVIVVRAEVVASVMRECVQKKVKAALIIGGGFRESGEEGARREAEIVEIARRSGIHFIGPNTMGHLDSLSQLASVSFVQKMRPGAVSLIAQSGSMGTRIMNVALSYAIGFNRFVCCGNEASIFLEDYLEYFAQDSNTRVIALYIEGLRDARRFLQVAKQITATKPIVVLKSGFTESAARASRSHVGALTGSDAVYTAAFKQAGVISVDDEDELCDVIVALLNQPLPRGNKVGILTIGGGLGVMATEACEKEGLEIAKLEPSTLQRLDALLPSRWSHGNPVDLVGSRLAHSADVTSTLWILMEDRNVDAVIANTWLGHGNRELRAGSADDKTAAAEETEEGGGVRQINQRVKKYGIPILVIGAPLQSQSDLDTYALFHREGLLIYPKPRRAARTLRHLNWYRHYLETSK